MLACNAPADLSKIQYPCLASTKLDGIRCLIDQTGTPVSRTLKPIRNRHIVERLKDTDVILGGLDGELIVGDPAASDCMRKTNSGVMSFDGEPDFTYYVFDIWSRPGMGYSHVQNILSTPSHPNIRVLKQYVIPNPSALEALERDVLDDGYEGLVIRPMDGLYKFGRSTAREGLLLKLKRYSQSEARIIGFEPLLRNLNSAETNALGYTQRSASIDGKVALDTLGAFVVEGTYNGELVIFRVGTGFTAAERDIYWQARYALVGDTITYKFFPSGSKDRPRHPVFISFRTPEDM
jgi:DNA ligase-1